MAKSKKKKVSVKTVKRSAPVKKAVVKKAPVKKAPIKRAAVKVTKADVVAAFAKPAKTKKKIWTAEFQRQLFIFLLGMFCMGLIWNGFSMMYQQEKCYRSAYKKMYQFHRGDKKMPPVCVEQDRKAIYNEREYAPYLKPGNEVIKGALPKSIKGKRMQMRGGSGDRTMTFEQVEVFANPVTSYSREWFTRNWAGKENLKAPDARAWKTHYKAKMYGDNFAFDGMPKGEYFVAGRACVKMDPKQKGCKEVRFGKRFKTDEGQVVDLDVVYRQK